jgi:peroxiredoxin
MTREDAPLTPGDLVPDVPLSTFDGGTTTLSSFGGRPLLIVCVRYYG